MTPVFLDRSPFGVYFFFGACSLVMVLGCMFVMPETRGRTLKEIDAAFHHHAQKDVKGEGACDVTVIELPSTTTGQERPVAQE